MAGNWFSRHRVIGWTAIGVGFAACLVFIAGFIPFSSRVLKDKVEQALRQSVVNTCTIRAITVTPWFGFTVEGLEIAKKDSAMSLSVSVPRIRLSYRLVPLLFKVVVIKKFSLERPVVSCVVPAAPPPRARTRAPAPKKQFSIDDIRAVLAQFPFVVVVNNISVVKGEATIEQGKAPVVYAKGIDVSMDIGLKKDVTLHGKFGADLLRLLNQWEITKLRTDLALEGFSVALKRCTAEFYRGTIDVSGRADLAKNVLDAFQVDVSNVDIKRLYDEARLGPGECSGWCDASLKLDKSFLHPDSLKGKGHVRLSKVQVRDLPLQKTFIVLIATPRLTNISFSKITAECLVQRGKVLTVPITGDGDPLEFTSTGWVGFDASLSQKVDGKFSRDLVAILPPIVANSLDEADNGKRAFTCSVSGTFANPKIKIDQRIVNRAVGNVVNEIGRGLQQLFH
jgi:hypothetical protein